MSPLPTQAAVLLPVLAHMALVWMLYAWLTVARAHAVRNGTVRYDAFEFAGHEPPGVARITRNLANQFELPVLYYAAVLALMQLQAATALDVWLGWVFVVGRILHTGVQTLTGNVMLRGQVFTLNALAVLGVLLHLAHVVFRVL